MGSVLDWMLCSCCQEIPHSLFNKCYCIFTSHCVLQITKPVLWGSYSLELNKFSRRLQRYRKIRHLTYLSFHLFVWRSYIKMSMFVLFGLKATIRRYVFFIEQFYASLHLGSYQVGRKYRAVVKQDTNTSRSA